MLGQAGLQPKAPPCFWHRRDPDRRVEGFIWVVVKIRVSFWVLIIIRHLVFRVPKKGP